MRIISAHAENSREVSTTTPGRRDHLRACGEQATREIIPRYGCGSSPRMRRTAGASTRIVTGLRIISAHAENSLRWTQWRTPSRDHLRACGEQVMIGRSACASTGSSPRMRRTVLFVFSLFDKFRIISAHAENSLPSPGMITSYRDHLRACGEQNDLGRFNLAVLGSSPRMRRTASGCQAARFGMRIISAHAENRPSDFVAVSPEQDHLRACGEQGATLTEITINPGSSPRMRRTVYGHHLREGASRIISAHAENSRLLRQAGSAG